MWIKFITNIQETSLTDFDHGEVKGIFPVTLTNNSIDILKQFKN